MLDWIQKHDTVLIALTGASVLLCVATLVIVPAIIVRIPPDYFAHPRRPRSALADRHPAIRLVLRIAKNVVGVILLAGGLAMLMLPGQGLLTILVGFFMIDFPGKYRTEKWLISRSRISRAINWLRRRHGREPLKAVACPQGGAS